MSIIVTSSRTEEDVQREVQDIREESERISASKETAKAYLIELGYLTVDGKLSPQYGG